tara:strand:+ start:118 stop:630 length:513 start_codon:yes stop_codon:yes gene_type:complete
MLSLTALLLGVSSVFYSVDAQGSIEDYIYEDVPAMRDFKAYQEILKEGDNEAHKLSITARSSVMLKDKTYPAAKMRDEYDRIKECGAPELMRDDDKALIVFTENPDTCFPYLMRFDYDRWLVDLYVMKAIYVVQPEGRWTIKPKVDNHPYAFGFQRFKHRKGDEIIYKGK